MPLTKDQISDLRSLQERVIQCTLANEHAVQALAQARAQLESFMWNLEHELDKGAENDLQRLSNGCEIDKSLP